MRTDTKTIPAPTLEQLCRAPSHPGEILADMLEAGGLSTTQAARAIGVTKGLLSQVRGGHRPMSAALMAKLARLFGTSVEFWGTLQMRHELWHALRDDAAALEAIVPLPPVPARR